MDQRARPPANRRASGPRLGAAAFERISAVEGLVVTPDLAEADREMARLDLTPAQRLDFLKARYGRQPVDG